MHRHWGVAAAFGLALALPSAAHAAEFTVADPTDAALRAAIEQANTTDGPDTVLLDGHEIVIGDGGLVIAEELTIRGPGTIDGGSLDTPILTVGSLARSLTLDGVRVTGGLGGAIEARSERLVIADSRIDDSVGYSHIVRHGPVETNGTLIIRDSQIVGNSIQEGNDGDESIVRFDPRELGGTLIVERSRLTDNVIATGTSGGVVDFKPDGELEDTATVRITDSVVSDNATGPRGTSGVQIDPDGVGTVDVQIVRSTFARNADGGALGFYPNAPQPSLLAAARSASAEWFTASLVVTDSTFEGNSGQRGGAIDIDPAWLIDSTVTVRGSTFAGNLASVDRESGNEARGGAINIWRGALRVENSTFSGNVVEGWQFGSGGGAIAVDDSAEATITHATITGNHAEGFAVGGGIAGPRILVQFERERGPVLVSNSIVAGNDSPLLSADRVAAADDVRIDDCDFPVDSGGGNLESGKTCGFAETGDKQNADPKLGALAANGGPTRTHALAGDSPAVNAALTAACTATDQRGMPRVATSCDSGAYELVPPATQPVTTQPPPPPPQGGVLGEQASNECLSSRRFKIRLRVPRGEQVRKAVVLVNGKRVKVKRGKRLTAVVDLRGLTKARYEVQITLHLKGGGKVTGVRRYWTCTPAIRWDRPPKV